MIDWSQYFDKIYCLHLIDSKDRKTKIEKELNRIGIDTKSDLFEWKITVKNTFYKFIQQNDNCNIVGFFRNINDTKGFNCSMGHYEILKEAEAEGFNKILIIEDDEKFLSNVVEIKSILDNMPKHYDVCLFDKYLNNYDIEHLAELNSLIDKNKVNEYYFNYSYFYINRFHFSSGGMYSLSKKAIKNFINILETLFIPIDFCTAKVNISDEDGELYKFISDSLIRVSSLKNIGIQAGADDKFNNVYCFLKNKWK